MTVIQKKGHRLTVKVREEEERFPVLTDLKQGAIFRIPGSENGIYMLIEQRREIEETVYLESINLETGNLKKLSYDCRVETLEGELTLKTKKKI